MNVGRRSPTRPPGAARRLLVALAVAVGVAAIAPETRAQSEPTVIEIRVHGNHSIEDRAVVSVAGIAVGDPAGDVALKAVEQRLRASGRFREVSVVRRYRSLSESDRVAVIITIQEKIPVARRLQVLPLVRYVEEEGLSYGARVSSQDLLGSGEFLSVPLSWGGVRRAALEARRPFGATVLEATVELRRWRNPHFDLGDRRFRIGLALHRRLAPAVFATVSADRSTVAFGAVNESLWRTGASLAFDTRPDRAFPWDSVLASVGWERLVPGSGHGANRLRLELAGYKRLLGQPVLAVHGVLHVADAVLPAYERPLLGGMDSLRGWEAGRFSGDSVAYGSAELRVPVTAPTSVARVGLTAFWDLGAAWNHGESLGRTRFHHGVGGGVFLIAPMIRVSVAVGTDLRGHARFHAGAGVSF